MKKPSGLQLISVFTVVAVVLFLFGTIYFRQIENEIFGFVMAYGWIALVFVTFLVEVTPQPIGPEISFVSAGLLSLNPYFVTILVLVVSTLAGFFNFYLGRFFYPNVCKDRDCVKYKNMYDKYGKWGLLISALGPVPFVPFCWTSGAFGLKFRQFIYYATIPRFFRIVLGGLVFSSYLSLVF